MPHRCCCDLTTSLDDNAAVTTWLFTVADYDEYTPKIETQLVHAGFGSSDIVGGGLVLKPLSRGSFVGSSSQDFRFIMQTVFACFQACSQHGAIYDFRESVSHLCTGRNPPNLDATLQMLFHQFGLQNSPELLTCWSRCATDEIIKAFTISGEVAIYASLLQFFLTLIWKCFGFIPESV